jgi:hypothetical protein
MPWQSETLGFSTDILSVVPFRQTIHVFSANNNGLDHIYLDRFAGTWRLEQLDYGCTTLAPEQISTVRVATTLHAFYRAHSGTAGRGIRHATFHEGTWQFETLDSPNTSARNCAAAAFNGQLHVFDHHGLGLMHHAWWDGQFWHFEHLDDQGSTGVDAAIAVFQNHLHVFSCPTGAVPGVRHGRYLGGWTFETLDSGGSDGGFQAAVFNQQLHVFGRPAGGGNWPGIRHGRFDGGWKFETLDVGSSSGARAALAYGGYLHVFSDTPPFRPAEVAVPVSTTDDTPAIRQPHLAPPPPAPAQVGVRHGWFALGRRGGGWRFETLDPDGSNPGPTTVATEFTPIGGESRLDVFTRATVDTPPAALRHLSFVPSPS